MASKLIEFLLRQGEGFDLEFKVSFSSSLSREICAFANANGGKILIGVDDSGKVIGTKYTNRLRSQIQDLARNLDPPVYIETSTIGNVVVLNVPEGKNKPYSVNGKFYLRHGSNTQQMKRNEIRDFFRSEGLILFDEILNNEFDIDRDFDESKYSEFIKLLRIQNILNKLETLENLNLYKHDCMTNAGVLLFAKDITRFFPQATITCVLFQGESKYKILDKREFSRDIYSNFHDAFVYLQSKLNTEYIIKDGPRVERLELPEDALREALLNSIAHRDYFVSGANILVEMFSNRVEITNPGGLIKGMTISDLGKKSLSRNRLLFGIMQRMGLVEKVGSGIKRMQNSVREFKLPELVFNVDDNWFTIIFYRGVVPPQKPPQLPPQKMLSGLEEKVLHEIEMDNRISSRKIAENLNISLDTVKEYLKKLKNKGVLLHEGPARGGYWVIIDF